MSCWKRLGLSPTKDLSAIKKAYAKAAKEHHPEDDPEGFLLVKEAYESALSYAKSAWDDEDFLSAELREEAPADAEPAEEPAPPTADFDFFAVGKPASEAQAQPQSPETPSQPAAFLDFSEVAEPGPEPEKAEPASPEEQAPFLDYDTLLKEGDSQQVQKAEELMRRMAALSTSGAARNSVVSWRAFFQSDAFLSMRRNAGFTERFLRYWTAYKHPRAAVWNQVFLPVLREWSYLWTGTPFAPVFASLQQPQGPQKAKPAKGARRRSPIFIVIVIAAFILSRGFLSASRSKPTSTVSIPRITSQMFADQQSRLYTSLRKPAGDALVRAIKNGEDAVSVFSYLEMLDLSESQYEALRTLYDTEGEEALEEAMEEILTGSGPKEDA